jgi:hypothetical protein
MSGIPRLPKCEDAACNLLSGHLGEHEIRSTFAERERERQRHVQRWYEQDQIIRELRQALERIASMDLRFAEAKGMQQIAAAAIKSANVSAATRSDLVVAEGVTLPVGEKPASREWEPSGKCQYDKCDGTRFDWDSTDSRWGSWFCVKCGGMQVPHETQRP